MVDSSQFSIIKIAIASPTDIIKWANGEKNEVKKPETINYRTFKPERDGLFCERIFGPVKDWECHCGKYKKIKHRGIVCERCGVEVTRSKVRRERMGFVDLAAPVSHIWYLKGVPSPMSLLLDMTPRSIEKVLYYANYVVTFSNRKRIDEFYTIFKEIIKAEEKEIFDILEEDIIKEREEFNEKLQEVEDPKRKDLEERRFKELEEHMRDDSRNDVKILYDGLELIHKKNEKDILTEEEYRSVEALAYLIDTLDYDKLRAAIDKAGVTNINTENKDFIKLCLFFEAGIGGASIKELLSKLDLNKLSVNSYKTQGSNQIRSIKILEVVEAFIFSKAKPEWMVLECLPIISPELRPMVQLDGGRFATSDLNDLYRRVINRNNRLQKIREINAPASIVNHEKRLLQEAVDAVIDNSRKQRPVVGSNNRPLKSLSDMLKGKEGRFRKNLLGKRVDYSGRSVIVVGPNLKLYQCGLPKEMALELFKPFVMKSLVFKGIASNIKSAKKMIDRVKPEVWDSLEEVISEHPVLLNRAPTLHRLGIQAFEPILVDGKAIQLHPLVCSAFNADFDGDQMAVHVPLSAAAQAESRALMLASHNLFSPADGRPIVAPSQDVVLGCFYLTMKSDMWTTEFADEDLYDANGEIIARKNGSYLIQLIEKDAEEDMVVDGVSVAKGEKYLQRTKLKLKIYPNAADAIMAYESGLVDLHDVCAVRLDIDGQKLLRNVTVGRLIFNTILPENMSYMGTPYNRGEDLDIDPSKRLVLSEKEAISKKLTGKLITECYERNGPDVSVRFLDDIKMLGYKYATLAGMSIAITDMDIDSDREVIIDETEKAVEKIELDFRRGRLGVTDRRERVLEMWTKATERIAVSLLDGIQQFNQIAIITMSGARGSTKQISQLSGMRGLMSDPFGNAIEDLPVTSNFHEGLSVLEYFVSTHGARKGLADTALRTADAGYLTRRLVDVAQDVIVREDNCKTKIGIEAVPIMDSDTMVENVGDRIRGRTALKSIGNPDDVLTENIYKYYEPVLFEKEIREIVTDEKPQDHSDVTIINTECAEPVVTVRKISEWRVNTDGEFKWIAESELKTLFPIVNTRTIEDKLVDEETGEETIITSEVETVFELDENKNLLVKSTDTEEIAEFPNSLVFFDGLGEIDPRLAWVVRDEIISDALANKIGDAWDKAHKEEKETGVPKRFKVWIRSPFTCESKLGICSKCYGKDLSLKTPVEVGTAVGIIAAQSIGEPGTQLTMRTFHTGGVAGKYLTGVANVKKKKQETLRNIHSDKSSGLLSLSDDNVEVEAGRDKEKTRQVQSLMSVLEDQVHGLLRVVELFEARKPKGKAIVADVDGDIFSVDQKGTNQVIVESKVKVREEDLDCLIGYKLSADLVDYKGNRLIKSGITIQEKDLKFVREQIADELIVHKSYLVPHRGSLEAIDGARIRRGERLTEGPLDPEQVLEIADSNEESEMYAEVGGELGVMKYMVEEIQKVYKSQGVDINDKHVEVIVRQMLRKVKVIAAKDTDLKRGQVVDRAVVKVKNDKLLPGQRKAIFVPILLGITDASLATDSFLSAASFQKTTRVLTEAAVRAKKDHLVGLKENVIIGRLIPAGTGLKRFRKIELLDAEGKPLPTKRYVYNPQNDRTALDVFDWKKGAKKCIEELGVKTVGQIFPKLDTLAEWGTGVEREIQNTIYRHIEERREQTVRQNNALVDNVEIEDDVDLIKEFETTGVEADIKLDEGFVNVGEDGEFETEASETDDIEDIDINLDEIILDEVDEEVIADDSIEVETDSSEEDYN